VIEIPQKRMTRHVFVLGVPILLVLVAGCSENPSTLNHRALDRMGQGDLETAKGLLLQAAAAAPEAAVIQANLAEVYCRLGEFEKAQEHQARAVELAGGDNETYSRRLAEILVLAGRPRQTVPALEKLWKQNPDDPNIGYALTVGYLLLNDESAARGLLASCRKRFPDEPRFETLEARMALRRGATDAAARILETVISRNPDYAEAHLLLGDLLFEKGEFEEAAGHYQSALGDGTNPEINLKLGKTWSRLGMAEKAKEALTSAARGEYMSEALLELASLYLRNPGETWTKNESLSGALEACAGVLRDDPLNIRARNLKALVYARRGQLSLMLNEFATSLNVNPDQPAVRSIVETYEIPGGE
jgi:tetratricopeptide (TPR) repeat protein